MAEGERQLLDNGMGSVNGAKMLAGEGEKVRADTSGSEPLEPQRGKLRHQASPRPPRGLRTRRGPSPGKGQRAGGSGPGGPPHLVVEDLGLLVGGRHALGGGGRQQAAAQAGPEAGGGERGGTQHAAAGAGGRRVLEEGARAARSPPPRPAPGAPANGRDGAWPLLSPRPGTAYSRATGRGWGRGQRCRLADPADAPPPRCPARPPARCACAAPRPHERSTPWLHPECVQA